MYILFYRENFKLGSLHSFFVNGIIFLGHIFTDKEKTQKGIPNLQAALQLMLHTAHPHFVSLVSFFPSQYHMRSSMHSHTTPNRTIS